MQAEHQEASPEPSATNSHASELSALCEPLLNPVFWHPDRLGMQSAWWGHVPFAFWLVSVLRPAKVVELGTYTGVSYAAFCQAVEKEQLACRCFAIDTWEGDDQTGYYAEGIFSDLKKFHDNRYFAFSALLREKFESAVEKFEDGSVDLLHIDGFHTYEAVKADFEMWMPKLSERGVILFHDSNEHSGDFGVWHLIDQLRERFPIFEFLHSHGLAVVSVGKQVPSAIKELCGLTSPATISVVRDRFTFLGSRWISNVQQLTVSTEATAAAAQIAMLQTSIDASKSAANTLHEQVAALQNQLAQQRASLTAENLALQTENKKLRTEHATLLLDNAARLTEVVSGYQFELLEARQQMAFHCNEKRTLSSALNSATHSIQELNCQLSVICSSVSWGLLSPFRSAGKRFPALAYFGDRITKAVYWAATLQLSRRVRQHRILNLNAETIRASGLLDEAWYRKQYPDVAAAGIDPAVHYLRSGLREGRLPNQLFDADWYLRCNPDVAESSIHPFLHYVQIGSSENRSPHPLFDPIWYQQQYSSVIPPGIEPLTHYLKNGSKDGRWPNPLFDPDWYRINNPDVVAMDMDPLAHYYRLGSDEGRRPIPLFDPDWYVSQYPDVASSRIEALVHYLYFGAKECRRPTPLFDSRWYQDHYYDVKASGMDLLRHYIHYGSKENRMPNPLFEPDWYRAEYPDVEKAGIEPLSHYAWWGTLEGRRPMPHFDPIWYAASNPDVRTSRIEPFGHYLLFGRREGRPPIAELKTKSHNLDGF